MNLSAERFDMEESMTTQNPNGEPLIRVSHLKQYFPISTGFFKTKPLKAVDDISFDIMEGETLGLVGESGCGKTTAGRSILHLYKPTGGEVIYRGKPIKTAQDIADYRRKATMVFQDPYSSLDPRMTVADIIGEPLDQRQRVGIARSLAVNPDFIVCDEPVSALDVSIQAQVINMFDELQEQLNLTYLFIAHDLLVVRHISDRIAVMYLGHMVELAGADEIYERPLHPYTRALISAVPVPDPVKARANQRIAMTGEIPSPLNAPPGCPFHTRCPYAKESCKESMPELREIEKGRFVACHRIEEIG